MCECGPKGNRKGLLALRGEESLRTTPMPIEWSSEQGQMEAADERTCYLQAATRSRPARTIALMAGEQERQRVTCSVASSRFHPNRQTR